MTRPAIVITSNTLDIGGAERQRVLLANELVRLGYRVQLTLLQHEGLLRGHVSPDVDVVLQPWYRPRLPPGPVVLVTGTTNTETGYAMIVRTRPRRGGRPPWLVAVHNHPTLDGPTFPELRARLMARSDGFIALSDSQWSALTRHQRLHRRVWFVPNGVVGPTGQPHPPHAPLRLGFVGRLFEQKGVDILLAALADVPGGGWTLDVYGDGPERAALEAAVAPTIRGQVTFHGWLPEVQKALDSFDVLVMPSRNEALPMVMLEAMSHGTPVVATDVGSMADVLDHGRCGVVVAGARQDLWTAAVTDLVADPSPLFERAVAAQGRLKEHYSVGAMAQAYLRVVEEVAPARHD